MTAPDPGLTDLIAAALGDKIMHTNGSGDRNRAYAAHVALVVEQHANGRMAPVLADFDWHIQNASNGAVCAAEADDGQALMSYQLEMGIYQRAAQLLRAALEGEA